MMGESAREMRSEVEEDEQALSAIATSEIPVVRDTTARPLPRIRDIERRVRGFTGVSNLQKTLREQLLVQGS
jgi:hypothetical protein